jgi:hypothetical protein
MSLEGRSTPPPTKRPLLHPLRTPLLSTRDTFPSDYRRDFRSEAMPAMKKSAFPVVSRNRQPREAGIRPGIAIVSETAIGTVASRTPARSALKQSHPYAQHLHVWTAVRRPRLWSKPPRQRHHQLSPLLRLHHRLLKRHANVDARLNSYKQPTMTLPSPCASHRQLLSQTPARGRRHHRRGHAR